MNPPFYSLLALGLLLLLLPARAAALPAGQQTYFLMGLEEQILDVLDEMSATNAGNAGFIPSPPNGAQSFFGITVPNPGQPIIYDHGEDGYEADYYNIPSGNLFPAGTTQIWNDGDPSNGAPPEFPLDVLPENAALTLESAGRPDDAGCFSNLCSFIPLPRSNGPLPGALRFDGQDVVFTVGQPINIVHVIYPENTTGTDTVIGGSFEIFPVESFAKSLTYTIPVGEDTYDNNLGDAGAFQAFRTVRVQIQATEDNTSVVIDSGANSTSLVLDKGEYWSSYGSPTGVVGATDPLAGPPPADEFRILQNTTVTGDKPIQVVMLTAGSGGWQTRFYNVIPTALYASEYVSPVYSGQGGTAGADIVINNPNSTPITVTAIYQNGGPDIVVPMVVPASSPATFSTSAGTMVPVGSAVRFTSPDLFWGIGIAYAGTAGGNGTGGDWGWSLQPSGFLDREIATPHGPGTNQQVTGAGGGTATDNGSPIWIGVLDDLTTIQVDFDGDGVPDQADIDNDGIGDGISFTRGALEALTLYDPMDADQTGAVITGDGDFTAAWGYLDSNAANDPGQVDNLDWGYTINPFDFRFLLQILDTEKDLIPNSILPGETTTVTICGSSATLAPVTGVDLVDVLPVGLAYVPASAIVRYPDLTSVALEPIQSGTANGGITLTWDVSHPLDTNETICVDFQIQAASCVTTSATITDSFNHATPDYTAGTGWTGNWTEQGTEAPTNAAAGQIRELPVAGPTTRMRLEGLNGSGDDARIFRQVDISQYCAPRLRIRRLLNNLNAANEGFRVELSTDGVNYGLLKEYNNLDPFPFQTDTFDISPWKSSTTYVRFVVDPENEPIDFMDLDFVEIVDSGFTALDVGDDFEFPNPPANPGSYQAGQGFPGPWTENGTDDGTPTGGDIQVRTTNRLGSCSSGNNLSIYGGESGGSVDEIRRPVDLSLFTSPQVEFDWDVNFSFGIGADGGTEFYELQESADGTVWTLVRQFTSNDEGGGCKSGTFALAAGTQFIRFTGGGGLDSGGGGGADTLIIDNLKITDGGAPLQPTRVLNCGFASGFYEGFDVTSDDKEPLYFSPLRITKKADKPVVQVGDSLLYTISVENRGLTTESNLEVRDPVPAFSSLLTPTSFTGVPAGSFDQGAKAVSWGLFSLAPSEIRTYTMTVRINTVPFDGTPITNIATLIQANRRKVEARSVVTGVRTPVLINLVKNAPGSVPPGGLVTFTFNLFNTGVTPATGAVLTDRIPREIPVPITDFVVGSAAGPTPATPIEYSQDGVNYGYSPVPDAFGLDPNVTNVRFRLGSIPAGGSVTATFTVSVPASTPTSTVIRNFGFLTNDQTTIRVTNITETVVSDLNINLVADQTIVCPTDLITFEATVSGGGSGYNSVIVTMPVPAETSLAASGVPTPSGWSVFYSSDSGSSFFSGEPSDPTTVDTLQFVRAAPIAAPVSEVLTFTVNTLASPSIGADILAQGTIDAVEIAPLPSNELRIPIVNLRVIKNANVTLADPDLNQTITYTLRIDNFGSVAATGPGTTSVILIDPVPTNTSVIGGTITDGGMLLGSDVVWSLGPMAPLSSVLRSFTVTIAGGTPGGTAILNQASATSQVCTVPSNLNQVLVSAPGVTAGPDNTEFGDQGDTICHGASIFNTSPTTADTIDLTAANDNAAWPVASVVFRRDVDGDGNFDAGFDTVLIDTDTDFIPDTGSLAPGTSLDILVCLPIPAGVPDGDQNITTVTARSSTNTTIFDTFQDTTRVNTTTAIFLTGMWARGGVGGVEVTWSTGREALNQGFLLMRGPSSGGPWVPVQAGLIPGAGTTARPQTYRVLDGGAPSSGPVYYKLIDVDYRGRRRHHPAVGIDRDGDGLAFDVEARFGLSDADPSDGAADPDGDGWTTAEELAVGRDPWLAEEAPTGILPIFQGATPPPAGVRLISETPERQVLELVLTGYGLHSRQVEGEVVSYPQLGEVLAGATERPGSPRLPLVGVHLPPGFGPSSTLEVLEVIEEAEDGVTVGPAPHRAADGANPTPEYRFDRQFYDAPPSRYPEGPATIRGPPGGAATLVFHPLTYDHAARRLVFRRRIRVAIRRAAGSAVAGLVAAGSPGPGALPPGTTFRLRTGDPGIYRMRGDALRAAGADPAGTDPRHVGLFRGATPIPIRILGEGDGVFDDGDVLEFYAADPGDRHAGGDGYWLHYGTTAALRWASRAAPAGTLPARPSYRHTESLKFREYYYPFDGPPGAERWVARRDHWATSAGPRTIDVPIFDAAATQSGGLLRLSYGSPVHFAGDEFHRHRLAVDGVPVAESSWTGSGLYRASAYVPGGLLVDGNRQVRLEVLADGLPPAAFDAFAPQDVALEYDRSFVAQGDALAFEAAASPARVEVSGLTSAQVTVLDVSNPEAPVLVTGATVSGAGPFEVAFGQDPLEARDLLVYGPAAGKTPIEIRPVASSDLRDPATRVGWLAVVPEGWEASLAPLVALRAAQGLEPRVVTLPQAAAEFTGGVHHPESIRRMLEFAHANWDRAPSYLLLAGDANANPRAYPGVFASGFPFTSDTVHVPTQLSVSGPGDLAKEAPDDHWFGRLTGGDDVPEVAVGRLPAKSAGALAAVAQKLVDYEAADGAWTRRVVSVADDQEEAFTEFAEGALGPVLSGLGIQRLHLGDGSFPSTSTYLAQLDQALQDGSLVVSFVGHAGVTGWAASPTFLDQTKVATLTNGDRLPVVFSMTCEDGYFGDVLGPTLGLDALAERMVMHAGGGAVAYLASGVQTSAAAKDLLHRALGEALFHQEHRRVGDTVREAMATFSANSTDPERLLRAFNLFGDPATRIQVPNPLMPASIQVTTGIDGAIELSWQPVSHPNLQGYAVYRRLGLSPATLIAQVPAPSYRDAGVPAGATAFYTIQALTNDGLGSAFPPEVGVLSQGVTAAPAPFIGGGGGGGGGCDAGGRGSPWGVALLYGLLLLRGLRRRKGRLRET